MDKEAFRKKLMVIESKKNEVNDSCEIHALIMSDLHPFFGKKR
jgi:hypothetical protein